MTQQTVDIFAPPTRATRKPFIGTNVTVEVDQQLDALAAHAGISKSELIRRLITIGLAEAARQAGEQA